MSESTELSFFENLWQRRFIQYTVSYLVACWGLLQFTDWVVKRYALSAVWVDIIILFFLAMLPSVLVIIYNHGRPGKDQWRKVEKILLPTNLIIAILVLFLVFSGEYLGATASKVTVTSEDGEEIERLVPNTAFTKRIAFFPFELVDKSATDLGWARLALPFLLGQDLNQDNRLYGWMATYKLDTKYQEFGYALSDKLPFSIQREMADDLYADEFISGTLQQTEDGSYEVKATVYDTKTGEAQFELSGNHKDPFLLIDALSKSYQEQQFKQDLSSSKISYVDLPITDLFTPSVEAYKAYHEGLMLSDIENKQEQAIEKYREALQIDPNFVEAYREKGLAHQRLNQLEAAQADLQKALDRMSGLSERQQFIVRLQYYTSHNDLQKALALLDMWRKLYPSNYMPYSTLIQIHQTRGEYTTAIEVGNDAIKNGHSRKVLLTLASLSASIGKFEEAKGYLEQFSKAYPDKMKETLELGEVYEKEGNFEKAEAHYEAISLLKPNDADVLKRLGKTAQATGDFKAAEQYFKDALRYTKTTIDSSWVYFDLALFHYNLGHGDAAIQALVDRWKTLETKLTAFERGSQYGAYPFMRIYADFGRLQEFHQMRLDHFEQFPDKSGFFTCSADLNYYIVTDDQARLKATIESCAEKIRPLTGETMLTMVNAYYEQISGNYSEAARLFEQYFAEIGQESGIAYQTMGEVYLLAGQTDKAITNLEKALAQSPTDVYTLINYAKALKTLGKADEADTQLDKVLKILDTADPEFRWLQEAQKLKAAWSES
ncbi:MAG: tetratricopeptide repeat protein [Phaeodactylibacter sp.]|nr:tetratricopeptide repeat protein [Phaeodactylibacter sp.]